MSGKKLVKKSMVYTKYVTHCGYPLDDYIDSLRSAASELVSEHGDGALTIEPVYEDDSAVYVQLTVTSSREETDKEYERRTRRAAEAKKKAAEAAAKKEAQEIEMLERLSKKYGAR